MTLRHQLYAAKVFGIWACVAVLGVFVGGTLADLHGVSAQTNPQLPASITPILTTAAPTLDVLDTMVDTQRDMRWSRDLIQDAYTLAWIGMKPDAEICIDDAVETLETLQARHADAILRLRAYASANTRSSLGWDAREYWQSLRMDSARLVLVARSLRDVIAGIDGTTGEGMTQGKAALEAWAAEQGV